MEITGTQAKGKEIKEIWMKMAKETEERGNGEKSKDWVEKVPKTIKREIRRKIGKKERKKETAPT